VLERVLKKLDVPYALQPGEGAFYGPKLEFVLEDRAGRKWQCGTIQFDLVMPERFDVRYVDATGQKLRAVMLHRALYGSLERFMGMLLEHHGAHLPAWLAPEQVVVLPVADMHVKWAEHVVRALRSAGLRARVDARHESLARRVADAHGSAAAFIAVVGGREVESRAIALRSREEPQEQMPLESALVALSHRCAVPTQIVQAAPFQYDLSV
jgi:threonyl-tRNA synthetase